MCKSSSLSTCLMMSCGVSHRCLTIDMQRMFCQRSTLRVGSSCYIPGVMGHPKNARGCHGVLSLCHLMYCHLPNISLWRLRKFTKSQSHLQQIPPISFILPQLCAHDAFKTSSNNMSPRLFFHSLCIRSSLPPSPVVPTGRFRGPWPWLSTASTAAPAARSCSTTAAWPLSAAQCSGVAPQAPKGSETSTAGSTPWLSTAHPHTWVEEARICSHYRCWCLWRSPRLRLRPDHTFPSGKNPKSDTELVVCLIKHHKTFCIRLFYTHKGLIKVAHVQDHLSKAVYPSRDNFMTSCALFPSNSPPCGSHLLEVHLQLRWQTPSNFIQKSMAPPSHNVRPVASVPSLGAAAFIALRLDGGARGQQRLDRLQVACPSRKVQRLLASVRRVPLEMATGRAKSHELLQRISGLKIWRLVHF